MLLERAVLNKLRISIAEHAMGDLVRSPGPRLLEVAACAPRTPGQPAKAPEFTASLTPEGKPLSAAGRTWARGPLRFRSPPSTTLKKRGQLSRFASASGGNSWRPTIKQSVGENGGLRPQQAEAGRYLTGRREKAIRRSPEVAVRADQPH